MKLVFHHSQQKTDVINQLSRTLQNQESASRSPDSYLPVILLIAAKDKDLPHSDVEMRILSSCPTHRQLTAHQFGLLQLLLALTVMQSYYQLYAQP